jgi:hypothetical protein
LTIRREGFLREKGQQPKEAGAGKDSGNSHNQPTGFDLFEVWKEYQKIATHFNDLLIRIRSQSLAAVATFATIAGVLVKGESINADLRWGALTAVFGILSIFWVANPVCRFQSVTSSAKRNGNNSCC